MNIKISIHKQIPIPSHFFQDFFSQES